VHGYDQKPKRQLFELLKGQGLQANQDVTFPTDGGEEVRALIKLVTSEAEHVLDWFYIAMPYGAGAVWAQQHTDSLRDDVKALELDYLHLDKFARSVRKFTVYIMPNAGSLINYGERFRSGERTSSAMAESTVNAVVNKRFAKCQQMQWTRRGAHLLLQTRTRALDGTLRPMFECWHLGLANDNPPSADQAAAA